MDMRVSLFHPSKVFHQTKSESLDSVLGQVSCIQGICPRNLSKDPIQGSYPRIFSDGNNPLFLTLKLTKIVRFLDKISSPNLSCIHSLLKIAKTSIFEGKKVPEISVKLEEGGGLGFFQNFTQSVKFLPFFFLVASRSI